MQTVGLRQNSKVNDSTQIRQPGNLKSKIVKRKRRQSCENYSKFLDEPVYVFQATKSSLRSTIYPVNLYIKQSLRENTYRPTFLVPKISESFAKFSYNDINTL